MNNLLIQILDVVSATLIVISLSLVTRWSKAWLLYAFSSFLFTIVCAHNKLPGLAIMGVILLLIGLKNYWVERKKRGSKG